MFGVITPVAAPVELYDAIHTELRERTRGKVDGLLLHVGRQTDEGFEVIEVWQSREDFERYLKDVVGPVIAELTRGQQAPAPPSSETFEVRGLVIPGAGIFD